MRVWLMSPPVSRGRTGRVASRKGNRSLSWKGRWKDDIGGYCRRSEKTGSIMPASGGTGKGNRLLRKMWL